jgi:phytanoyl-CoA hydroxylase
MNFKSAAALAAGSDQFRAAGFCILRGYVEKDDICRIASEVSRYMRVELPHFPSEDVVWDTRARPAAVRQFYFKNSHASWLSQFPEQPKWRYVAETLLGEPVDPQWLEYFDKPPGGGDPTPPHQDGYGFKIDPPIGISLWLPLDSADEDNGCLRYVVGSHREGLVPHSESGVKGFSKSVPEGVWVEHAAAVAPGDVIAHHTLTIHRAYANQSSRPRRALGLIYFASSAARLEVLERVHGRTMDFS